MSHRFDPSSGEVSQFRKGAVGPARICARLACVATISPIAHRRRIFCSDSCRTLVKAARSTVTEPRCCNRCGIALAPMSHGLRLYCGERCWRLVAAMQTRHTTMISGVRL